VQLCGASTKVASSILYVGDCVQTPRYISKQRTSRIPQTRTHFQNTNTVRRFTTNKATSY